MMYNYYSKATGEITGWLNFPDDPPDDSYDHPLLGLIAATSPAGDDPATYYVAGSPLALTPRPAMPSTLDKTAITANGSDAATISAVPANARATIQDANGTASIAVTDGSLALTALTAQTITVRLTAWPYLDTTYTVTAA